MTNKHPYRDPAPEPEPRPRGRNFHLIQYSKFVMRRLEQFRKEAEDRLEEQFRKEAEDGK